MLNRLACGRWGIREMKGKTPQARKQRASEQCMLFLLSQAINDSFCAIKSISLNKWRQCRWTAIEKAALRVDGAVGQFWPS
ncbi:hypothetical protein D917_02448 [Trichinella nativa]|uniref:Uncharacterized protein n=1 Tax=Trichinella nativa TaxID=6335 RepID=A0A1Y3EF64_9BILA|nr:hypothetical protein D917_02448 [Trichinella nativa]